MHGNTKKVRSGAVMAEMVIVLPVLFLVLFGTMQLAMLFTESLQLQYAAYQSGRGGDITNVMDGAREVIATHNGDLFTLEKKQDDEVVNAAAKFIALEYDAPVYFSRLTSISPVGQSTDTKSPFGEEKTLLIRTVTFAPSVNYDKDYIPNWDQFLTSLEDENGWEWLFH